MIPNSHPPNPVGALMMSEGDRQMIENQNGLVPGQDGADSKAVSVELSEDSRIAVLEKARFMGEDRFRLLRHHLKEIRLSRRLKSLIVTSAIPQDGKSTIAINTAAALVDGGRQRVLLVEADLHCPSLGRTLGLDAVPGTAECLELGSDPFSYIRKVNPLGFYFLQAGSAAAHPTDLIQSESFPGVLEKVYEQFDWIVIDTPPICPVPDTLSMWKHVDGVLMVVRSAVTPRERADETLRLVGPERLAAVIFNGSVEATESYYKYSSYYGSKYGYSRHKT